MAPSVRGIIAAQRSIVTEDNPTGVTFYLSNSSGATRTIVAASLGATMTLTRRSGLEKLIGQIIPPNSASLALLADLTQLSFSEVYSSAGAFPPFPGPVAGSNPPPAGMPVPAGALPYGPDVPFTQLLQYNLQLDDGTFVSWGNEPLVTVVPPYTRLPWPSRNSSPFGQNQELPGPGQQCLDFSENSAAYCGVGRG